MHIRYINQNIKTKIDNWIKSIDDKSLVKLLKKKGAIMVSGGSIASLLLDEKVNDYDIYLTNKDTLKLLCEYYIKKSGKDIKILTSETKTEYSKNIASLLNTDFK